jgi:hypothetical protein
VRYDPQNDPYQDLNDPAVLDNTPIGTLRVVPWANAASVAVMDAHDPTIVRKIIHTLHVDENPLNAIYGKRPNEATAWREIYDARDADEARQDANHQHAVSTDTIADAERIRRKHADADEGFAMLTGEIPWDVKD